MNSLIMHLAMNSSSRITNETQYHCIVLKKAISFLRKSMPKNKIERVKFFN